MRKLGLCFIITAALAVMHCSEEAVEKTDKGVAQADQKISFDQGGGGTDQKVTPDLTKADAKIPQKVEFYAPGDNAVSGWVEDTSVGALGVEAGYTTGEIEGIIDGAHDPYRDEGCKGFVKQDYKMGDLTLQLYLWDMETAAGALKMFNADKTKGEDFEGLTFEVVADVSDQAILANDALVFKGYLVKNNYIAKISSRCLSSQDLVSLKNETVAFITYLANQLP